MSLPATFKKIFNANPADNAKQASARDNKERNDGNKKKRKSKNGNGNLIRNMSQDNDFEVAAGETWITTFSKQFPQDRPTWEDKIKMCVRWHIKGDCYDNCSGAISHVLKDNIPAEKKANFLTFIKECREAAKKNDCLLGLEPSSVRPPEKPPLPTRTFHSLLNSNFILPPQTDNNNMANTSSHQEILTSQLGNSIQHQHESSH
jgi:hypothetical protein